jgi:hypothetical protein
MKGKTRDLIHDLTFSAHTINCVCHSISSMFRVLGIYNFGRQLVSQGNFGAIWQPLGPFVNLKIALQLFVTLLPILPFFVLSSICDQIVYL